MTFFLGILAVGAACGGLVSGISDSALSAGARSALSRHNGQPDSREYLNPNERFNSRNALRLFHADPFAKPAPSSPETVSGLALVRRSSYTPARLFLGVGDGIYNTADPRWMAFRRRPSSRPTGGEVELPRLPGTSAELENCAMAVNARRVLLLRGLDCSLLRLQQALSQHPDVIHIGAHVVSFQGSFAIELGIDGMGRRELLTSADIRRLRVPGSIVTMAGCGSAADVTAGPGAAGGLMGAWLAAGARAVIGARGQMPDNLGEFFPALYGYLLDDSGPGAAARALRYASRDILRSEAWRARPGYQAAFTAIDKE